GGHPRLPGRRLWALEGSHPRSRSCALRGERPALQHEGAGARRPRLPRPSGPEPGPAGRPGSHPGRPLPGRGGRLGGGRAAGRPRGGGRGGGPPDPAAPGHGSRPGLGAEDGPGVIVGDDWQSYGVGAEIAARLAEEAFEALRGPVLRVGGAEVPMPYAANLERLALPQVDGVIRRAARLLEGDGAWLVR